MSLRCGQIPDPDFVGQDHRPAVIDVFDAEAKKIASDGNGSAEFLAQGTLYPDVTSKPPGTIESD